MWVEIRKDTHEELLKLAARLGCTTTGEVIDELIQEKITVDTIMRNGANKTLEHFGS